MKKPFVLAAAAILYSSIVFGQGQSNSDDDAINAFDNKGSKAFEVLEQSGKISGCVLSYNYSYRDYKNNKGNLIQVLGNIRTFVLNRPSFNLMTDVTATDITFGNDGKLTGRKFRPAYFSLSSEGQNLDKYKKPVADCFGDQNKLCNVFVDDRDASLVLQILKSTFKPMEVAITTVENGYDKKIDLDSLDESDKSKPIAYDSKFEFFRCIARIVDTWKKH